MRRTLLAILAVAAASSGWLIWRHFQPRPDDSPPPLMKLTPEQIRQLPDPHQPMPPAGSALWCASTHAAWKQLPALLKVSAPVFTSQRELSAWMNTAADPAGYVPAGSLFSLAGPASADTIARIHDGVQRQFGEPVMLPLVPGGPDDFIAFARLQVAANFPVPYANRQGGLPFRDASGKTTTVRAFGNVPGSGEELLPGLSQQPRVLYADPEPKPGGAGKPGTDEFAINLSGNTADVQVIVACVARPAALHAAWEHVEKRSRQCAAELSDAENGPPEQRLNAVLGFPVSGRLAVPLLGFEAASYLPDLQHPYESPPGWRINTAAQVIQFSLDRTGARLKAETAISVAAAEMPTNRDYIFDRPFLLAMRQREAAAPFFLLWVDDAAAMSEIIEN